MSGNLEGFLGEESKAINKFEDEEVHFDNLLRLVSETGGFLNKEIVNEGVRRIEIISIERSYLRNFNDGRPSVPCIDLKVKVISDGKFKGQEFIFTIRRMNIKKMIELFSSDKNNWIGKRIHLSVIKTPKGDSIVVDSD